MFSLEQIRKMNDDATRAAKRAKRQPVVLWPEGEERPTRATLKRRIPMIGDHVPSGWRLTGREAFVDSSGWGQDDEPAMTLDRFLAEFIREGYGYGANNQGQFQVYVAEYARTKRRVGKPGDLTNGAGERVPRVDLDVLVSMNPNCPISLENVLHNARRTGATHMVLFASDDGVSGLAIVRPNESIASVVGHIQSYPEFPGVAFRAVGYSVVPAITSGPREVC